jgi:hypothetical protein
VDFGKQRQKEIPRPLPSLSGIFPDLPSSSAGKAYAGDHDGSINVPISLNSVTYENVVYLGALN